MSEGSSGRFARWSQRKAASRQAARGGAAPIPIDDAADPDEAKAAPIPQASLGRPADAPDSGQTRAEENDKTAHGDGNLSLPDLDDLDAHSDYTPFLAKGVPEAMTRAALRKLWQTDPTFSILDGLDIYNQDFNLSDQAITIAETSYQVGSGYLDEPKPDLVEEPDETAVAQRTQPACEPKPADRESDVEGVEVGSEVASSYDQGAEDDGDENAPDVAFAKKSHDPESGPAETA